MTADLKLLFIFMKLLVFFLPKLCFKVKTPKVYVSPNINMTCFCRQHIGDDDIENFVNLYQDNTNEGIILSS